MSDLKTSNYTLDQLLFTPNSIQAPVAAIVLTDLGKNAAVRTGNSSDFQRNGTRTGSGVRFRYSQRNRVTMWDSQELTSEAFVPMSQTHMSDQESELLQLESTSGLHVKRGESIGFYTVMACRDVSFCPQQTPQGETLATRIMGLEMWPLCMAFLPLGEETERWQLVLFPVTLKASAPQCDRHL